MVQKLIEESFFAYKEMPADFKNSAEYRWLNKEVKDELLLFDCSRIDKVELRNTNPNHEATMHLSKKYALHDFSLLLEANAKIENIKPRPVFSIKINLDNIDLSNYNRIRVKIYIEAEGYQNFYFHLGFGNPESFTNHAPSLIPNQLNDIVFEVSRIKRDKVEYMTITPFLMGCPPEALPKIKVYILEIKAEVVDIDYDLGWDLNERIAFCHSGYYLDKEKVAIIQNSERIAFLILDENDNVAYKGISEKVDSLFGDFQILDFTPLQKEGIYKIKIKDQITGKFVINNDPFLSSLWKSLNFLRMLRCGEDIFGVHSACHLNCKTYDEENRTVPNFGGWHDAGDVSQFEICTAEIAHSLLDLAKKYKEKDKILYERILDEAKVGVSWLLRTRFGNGYRACAVTYSIWRDNILSKDNETILTNQAENGPFENFCAAACEAEAYLAYKDIDRNFANWCLRAAKEDFEFGKIGYAQGLFTKRWGQSIAAQTSGEGAIAATILYQITNDDYYLKMTINYLDTVLKCQQREYLDWDIKIRGFFLRYRAQIYFKL